eukprot:scaffold81970_cov71-Phaeocystis_antarctica.AAC.1
MWGRRQRQWHVRLRRHARSELGRMRWLSQRCCPPSRVQRQLAVDQVAQRVTTRALAPPQSLLPLRHPPPPPARQLAVQPVPKPFRHAVLLTLGARRRLNAFPPAREACRKVAPDEIDRGRPGGSVHDAGSRASAPPPRWRDPIGAARPAYSGHDPTTVLPRLRPPSTASCTNRATHTPPRAAHAHHRRRPRRQRAPPRLGVRALPDGGRRRVPIVAQGRARRRASKPRATAAPRAAAARPRACRGVPPTPPTPPPACARATRAPPAAPPPAAAPLSVRWPVACGLRPPSLAPPAIAAASRAGGPPAAPTEPNASVTTRPSPSTARLPLHPPRSAVPVWPLVPPRAPHAANREARRLAAPSPPAHPCAANTVPPHALPPSPPTSATPQIDRGRPGGSAHDARSRASAKPAATAPPTAPTRATARGAAGAEALSTRCPADAGRSPTPQCFPASSRSPPQANIASPHAPPPSPPTSSTLQIDRGRPGGPAHDAGSRASAPPAAAAPPSPPSRATARGAAGAAPTGRRTAAALAAARSSQPSHAARALRRGATLAPSVWRGAHGRWRL